MKNLITISLLLFTIVNYSFSQGTTKPSNKPFLEHKSSIAGKSGGEITRDELLKAKRLELDSAINSEFHIFSFKMSILGENIKEFEKQGNSELNPEMLEELKNASPGCKLFFEYIRVTDSTNSPESMRSVRAMAFTIKE